MKRDRLFSAFSDIDDAYVKEARPKKMPKKKNAFIRFGALAACLALLCAWLFVPFNYDPDAKIARYQGSEYYPVISKINTYLTTPPKHKNNFEKILSNILMFGANFAPGAGGDMNGSSGEPEHDADYVEVTDNQVAGVIEADLIKRTSTHFFYLDGTTVKVYSIAGEESALVSKFEIPRPEQVGYVYSSDLEFYLSEDTKRLTVIYPYMHKERSSVYDIISLNVENPESICEISRTTVTGAYTSSRLVDGTLLVIGEYYIHNNPDYGKEETFLPQFDTGDGFESIPMDNIVTPDKVESRRYTVVTKYDEQTLTLKDTLAVLSYSDILYVSDTSLYLTRGYTEKSVVGNYTYTTAKSEILRIDYTAESFFARGTASVDGSLKDQYSLDEYEGTLRAVTTTGKSRYMEYTNGMNTGMDVGVTNEIFGTSASLYLIDIETMREIASVVDFAPIGETVRSVRFDGTDAYVCTAVQSTDPVFFFDLSDPESITYKDTGTIAGFSTSLIQMGNGFLLGIGRGESWNSVKVEVYEESESGVVSVAKYEILGAEYANEYKSYLVDRQNGLFGFGYTSYYDYDSYGKFDGDAYCVLLFDGYTLHEIANVPLSGGNARRAVHIDGYLYFFGSDAFTVVSVMQ